MSDDTEYWKEVIEESAEQIDLSLGEESAEYLAKAVSMAHNYYGQAFYDPVEPNASERIIEDLRRKLQREEGASFCDKCSGTGRLQGSCGSHHMYDTECHVCGGKGKLY